MDVHFVRIRRPTGNKIWQFLNGTFNVRLFVSCKQAHSTHLCWVGPFYILFSVNPLKKSARGDSNYEPLLFKKERQQWQRRRRQQEAEAGGGGGLPLHPAGAPRVAAVVRAQVPAAGGRGCGRRGRALRERRAHRHRQEAAAAGEEDQVRPGRHRLIDLFSHARCCYRVGACHQ